MSYELWPATPHFVCCCGRVFFRRDRDRMWDHAEEHVTKQRAMRDFQAMVNAASASEPEAASADAAAPMATTERAGASLASPQGGSVSADGSGA